ncbi:hypothetical protein G6F23_014650 [Rhizopus arrhizus]|nr:hypothetical protein G6F23_014650 [Rhizopus arrhizus]
MAPASTPPWMPELCRLPRLAAMLGLAELVVVVLALAPDGSRHWTFGELLSASGVVEVAAGTGGGRGDRPGDPDRGGLRRHRACAVRGAGGQLRQWYQLLALHPGQCGHHCTDHGAGAALFLCE